MATYTSKIMDLRKAPPSSGDLQPGVWYSNFTRVKNYAINNGYGLFAVWWSGDGCPQCKRSVRSMLCTTFKNWMKSSGLMFWFGCGSDTSKEDRENGTGYTELWYAKMAKNSAGLSAYPFWWFYWKNKSGKEKVNSYFGGAGPVQGADDDAEHGAKAIVKNVKELFSGYQPPAQTYTVQFKDWDGTALKAVQKVNEGGSAVPPADPSREGYEFTGWLPPYAEVGSNLTCVAQYKKVETGESAQPGKGPSGVDPTGGYAEEDEDPINVEADKPVQVLQGQRKILVSNNVSAWQMVGDGSAGYNDLKKSLKAVVFGKNCYSIEPSCFYGCENLESVIMPASCRKIGECAFYGCSGLKYVTCLRDGSLPMEEIGSRAFEKCVSLTEVYVNLSSRSSDATVGERCFAECTGLTSFNIRNMPKLAPNMLEGCTGITSVTVPEGVTGAEPNAFAGMTGLKSVSMPASLAAISDRMFSGDVSLSSVSIRSQASQLVSLGACAFQGCQNLKEFSVPGSVTSISCVDDMFLSGSQVSCVEFKGVPDTAFTTGKVVSLNLGNYKTGVKYRTEKDVKAALALALKHNIPILMGLTNYVDQNDTKSPDYGYTPVGNYGYSTCPHCRTFRANIENAAEWKNWLKTSGVFYVVGGDGPFGSAYYDAKVKYLKSGGMQVYQVYRYYDAGKAMDAIRDYRDQDKNGFFIMTYYWKKADGSVKRKCYDRYDEKFKTASAAVKDVKSFLQGYTPVDTGTIKYEVNKDLTTFGSALSCVFVSSTGKRYEITNKAK